ncbi:MAG TPA: succinate dehydrogenase/fumarate reductase flavoprotein subunit [Alphaproteobacteria bacterium]|nr:succinate dehydrogenase/fumarate reductase flavoprotein subunit [Alphaproteobacteria bacterium]
MKIHDILIVGAGLTGLRAAFEGITADLDVAVLTKVHPLRSHSCAAQGGVNAAIDKDDDWRDHAYDTVKGADFIGDEDSIELMCKEAPQAVLDLDDLGCPFSRNEDGSIAQRAFGGASFARTAYAADRTGHAMLHTLWEQAIKHGTHIYQEYHLLKIIKNKLGHACGVVAMEIATGKLEVIRAKTVLIATGGYGRVYKANTNAMINTGDGIALAMKAGANLADLEFVQFHPTGLKTSGILISEGVRGEGAYLIGKDGKRFMSKYAPNKLELASRDVVSRSEAMEIMAGNGVDGAVFLDVRHLGRDLILERLPQIRQLSIDFEGVDPVDKPIPVRPTCHYTMGGIRTEKLGQTNVKGLYSAGEASCTSVHGANRLGANSLLETIVFGKFVGKEMVRFIKQDYIQQEDLTVDEDVCKDTVELLNKIKNQSSESGIRPAILREKLTEAMNKFVGVFRNEELLAQGLEKILEVKADFEKVCVDDKSDCFNTDLLTTLELGNLILLAEATVKSALERKESRGAHTREEYPARDDENYRKHTIASINDKGHVVISYEPVRLVNNDRYKPVERVY